VRITAEVLDALERLGHPLLTKRGPGAQTG
jgi:hypothetical protein